MLDEYKLDRVYAWGHPDGLEGGRNEKAFEEMVKSIEYAKAIGAKVMRVVGASLMFRNEPHGPMLEKLTRMFEKAVKVAAAADVKLADENHIDFTSDEMLSLIKAVNSPYFGINFDTGNFMRVLDDPVKGMQKLAKYVFATHIKDLKINREAAVDDWFFFSRTPVGDGLVDNQKLAAAAEGRELPGLPGRRDRLPPPRLQGGRGQGRGAEREGAEAHREGGRLTGRGTTHPGAPRPRAPHPRVYPNRAVSRPRRSVV